MMRIFGVAVVSSFVYVYVKRYNPEYAIAVELAGVGLVIIAAIPQLREVIDFFYNSSEDIQLDRNYISIIIKSVGISFLTQLSADICRDAGQNAVASKIEFAGKLMLAFLAVPVAKALLETAIKMIGA